MNNTSITNMCRTIRRAVKTGQRLEEIRRIKKKNQKRMREIRDQEQLYFIECSDEFATKSP